MFKYLAFFALIAFAAAAGSPDDVHAEVKTLQSDVRHDGFAYTLETSNHIQASETGDEHGNAHGNFEWVSPEGVHVKVNYVADENGYQPQSDLLPIPPPIPDQILKAIAYIQAHPPAKEDYHH